MTDRSARSMWLGFNDRDGGLAATHDTPQQLSSGAIVVFNYYDHDEDKPTWHAKRPMGFGL